MFFLQVYKLAPLPIESIMSRVGYLFSQKRYIKDQRFEKLGKSFFEQELLTTSPPQRTWLNSLATRNFEFSGEASKYAKLEGTL